MINQKNNPLISVIVPVYNMEKYLKRCVDSILKQTYENLELILVNDCSTDSSAKIIDSYMNSDDRVRSVNHEENRGLFQARITGSEIATGKYIAFVDSDDYISVDWFRKLVRQAEQTNSDMVVGEWCFDTDGKHKDYCNLDHFRVNDYCLEGEKILDTFMAVQGRNYSWTVVWNKLYSKELWDKCYPLYVNFSKEHGHMIMWEYIAFSSALWANAKKVTNVHNILYYYFKHNDASTKISNSKSRNEKYIRDSSAAVNFFKTVLKETGHFEKYEEDFERWITHSMSIVYRDLVVSLNSKTYKKKILDVFNRSENDYEEPSPFFYSITTPLHDNFNWLESLKGDICSEKIKYVSFDVFDTLIQRPFYKPTDLFQLLSEKVNEGLSAYVNIKAIREHAEYALRQEINASRPSKEEITLDEIYGYIKENYAFSDELVNFIKQTEIDLEIRYCEQRKSGKELFDLALEAGKTVIICSDMYLSKEVIEKILRKNDIVGYHKLYVSSEYMLSKFNKTLYDFVQKDLKCKNSSLFLHIGDNYHSDVANSASCGWNSQHLVKATDILFNENLAIYSGEAFQKIYIQRNLKEDYWLSFYDFSSVRTMMGIIANKFYDNPYASVNTDSDFNADPRLIGYSTLGPHLLALCQWIYKTAKRENIGTVHFVARDGFLVKKAFDSFKFPDVKSNYIRLSRKALALADVETPEDLYSLYNKVNPFASVKTLSGILAPIIPEDKKSSIEKVFGDYGFKYEKKLKSLVEWEKIIKIFIEEIVNLDLLPVYKQQLKNYFSEIVKPGDYIFDIGYSGRPESSLTSILGFPVGSMYIHINGEMAGIRQDKYNCPCEVFYQYKPGITGVMREHLLMELGPSTIGYELIDGKLAPKFEDYNSEYCSTFITEIVQEYALQFINDYNSLFSEFKIMYNFQNEVVSALFEYYLHFSKPLDRYIFSTLPFEDDLGLGKLSSSLDFWNNEINIRNFAISYSGDNTLGILPDLYVDGYFVKFYHVINRLFPKGGRAREVIKKIAGLFLK